MIEITKRMRIKGIGTSWKDFLKERIFSFCSFISALLGVLSTLFTTGADYGRNWIQSKTFKPFILVPF